MNEYCLAVKGLMGRSSSLANLLTIAIIVIAFLGGIMENKEALLKRIVVNPEIMVGKPIIKGTRLTVEHIVAMYAAGMTNDEILEAHTQITKEDLQACFMFMHEMLSDITFAPQILTA